MTCSFTPFSFFLKWVIFVVCASLYSWPHFFVLKTASVFPFHLFHEASAFIVNRWLILLLINCKPEELCEQACKAFWSGYKMESPSNSLVNAVQFLFSSLTLSLSLIHIIFTLSNSELGWCECYLMWMRNLVQD